MKKLTVCFINFNARGLFIRNGDVITYGGAEVQIFQLINYLTSLPQYAINLITAGPKPFGITSCGPIKIDTALSLNRRWGIFSKVAAVVRLLIALHRSHADIYLQRAIGVETGLVALYCKLYRKKFVYMIAHEWDVSGQFIRENGLIGRFAFNGLKRATLRIAQNNDQRNMLQKNYNLDSTVFPSVHTMPTDILPQDQREYILWVGRAEEWKQPQLFLEIARQLPNQKFVMIMPKGNYPELYKQILEAVKLLPNLRLITAVPFEEIDTYFQRAQAFINTSTMEGFPNTFIQSAKYGTPIVSIHVDPDKIIQRYSLGRTTHNQDITILVQALEQVITSQNFPLYSKHCIEYAKEFHDIAKFGNVFSTLLQTATK